MVTNLDYTIQTEYGIHQHRESIQMPGMVVIPEAFKCLKWTKCRVIAHRWLTDVHRRFRKWCIRQKKIRKDPIFLIHSNAWPCVWIDSIAIPWRIIQQIKTGELNILNPQGISWIWDQPSTGDLFTWSHFITSPSLVCQTQRLDGFSSHLAPFLSHGPSLFKSSAG